jgi:hypothetical protein
MTTSRRTTQRPRRPRIERERSQFKRLLLANPNYFGTAPQTGLKAAAEAAGNTKYEELGCIGFEPGKGLLEATVQVKLAYGYGGSLCAPGSTEYVRFYVDLGAGWTDVGVAAFNAHDLPDDSDCFGDPEKPLSYVVTVPYKPRADVCDNPTLPNVRAILSWELMPPPNDENWTPVWGNVHECHVQLDPAEKSPWWWVGFLKDQLVDAGIDVEAEIPPTAAPQVGPVPLPDPPPEFAWPLQAPPTAPTPPEPLPLTELGNLYRRPRGRRAKGEREVPPERFVLPHIAPLIARPGLDPEVLVTKAEEWKGLKLDVAAVAAAFEDQGDTTYEELECVGLEYNLERLVATFRVKLPFGYSGPLCGPGSVEYVAFWADWEDRCEWTYVGTAQVVVHDLPIPPDGLCYSIVLPVDVARLRRRCEEPRIVRVRGVLSWAVPPSTTDPDALTRWGNRLDTHVQIPPGDPIGDPAAVIAIIGGIPTSRINLGTGLTTPNAFFALSGIPPDPLGRPCPFGGLVAVQGYPFTGYKYRVSVRRLGDLTWVPVTTTLVLTDLTGTIITYHSPDAQGFFMYVPPSQNVANLLAWWWSAGDDLWELQLELADMANTVLDTTVHRVQLDNTSPEVDVQISGLAGNCGKFGAGTPVTGTFVARDLYLGSWSVATSPQPPAPVNPSAPTPSSGTIQTPPSPGSSWSLNTANMTPCGYTITATAVDRAIVNSAAVGHWASMAQGFCIE